MIMLRLTRAMGALAFACTMFPLAGCGSRDAAARMEPGSDGSDGSDYFAAADGKLQPEHGAVPEMDATPASLIELHHFNVYKNYRAMLDAPAGAHDGLRRGEAGPSSGEPDYFPCMDDSLVKRDD